MSQHLCPNCKHKTFTWYMDSDERTWWSCSFCEFNVEEDESKEKECIKCMSPFPNRSVVWLKDIDCSYFWCCVCGLKTGVTQKL